MKRQIISIDRERCVGCGACAKACHQGAIAMVDGKAKLVREDHCDGLGNCLPVCTAGAIAFTLKDVSYVDENAIPMITHECSCAEEVKKKKGEMARWPIQISLVPLKARFFDGNGLLVATDCTAFVSKCFHDAFVDNRVILIGCPKLDRDDHRGRLAQIIGNNDIRSVSLVRMEVPCCSAMENIVRGALTDSGKDIPLNIAVLSTDGDVVG